MRWQHPIVDADTHINEPPTLWVERVPRNLRARAPHVTDLELDGKTIKMWSFDGADRPTPFLRLLNTAGISPLDWTLLGDNYDGRAGAWDPAARIVDMDIDGTDVHVLFPSYAMGGAAQFSSDDAALQLACVRAYNDWMSEFCAYAPDRLVGVALVPVTGVDDAIAEARRVRELIGLRGVLLTAWPNGSSSPKPEDDRFWSAMEDLDLAVTIHVGFSSHGEGDAGEIMGQMLSGGSILPWINMERVAGESAPILSHLVLGGVFERHPRLRLSLVETGAGWLPFFFEQTDDNWFRHRHWAGADLTVPPSEYWQRQCYATFQIDTYAIGNRERIGTHTMCWSSDYPHSGADWPNSRESIANQMRDVSEVDRRMMLYENAARLYGLPVVRGAESAGATTTTNGPVADTRAPERRRAKVSSAKGARASR